MMEHRPEETKPTMTGRPVRESIVEMTELVLPNDANQLGNLLGGKLMHLIDIAAAIAAARHAQLICVTASVDDLNFHAPIRTGQVVILHASVNRVFNTSMEVGVKVYAEDLITGQRVHANSAYLTFVGLHSDGTPARCRPVLPETAEEKRRFDAALVRRNARLEKRRKQPAGER